MKITRYFPNFCSGFDDPAIEAEFKDAESLLAIDWVKRWSNDPNFLRYSISSYSAPDFVYLMAEFRKGWFGKRSWHVVGYVKCCALYHDPYAYIGIPRFKS